MSSSSLQIQEFDEAGNVTATYVQSEGESKALSRVDVIPPKESKTLWKTAWQKGIDVFLPVGYPNSVTHDYTEYQIYDSLQAFTSSIASLLSSRAVLSSVGVGDSDATPTAAILLSILQSSIGRISTILFAHRFGTSLEPECKMYRLLADVLNDTGFVLDCISPVFPKPIRVAILSFSSVLRSLCGVAAGSAKASLSAHFACWGNLGELNAKDASQETVISLLGMWAGSLVISWVTTPTSTWIALMLLLSIHLETNRRAVRAVSMRTLNRQRATLVYHYLSRVGHAPTPEEISAQERIFEWDGVLRAMDDRILGHCTIGAPLSRLLTALSTETPTPSPSTKSSVLPSQTLSKLLSLYTKSNYILWHDPAAPTGPRRSFFVVCKRSAQPVDLLQAWWHALVLADPLYSTRSDFFGDELQRFDVGMDTAKALLEKFGGQLREKGWDLETGALETGVGRRVGLGEGEGEGG